MLSVVNWHLDCKQLPVEPAVLMEQSNLFYEARIVVLREINSIEKEDAEQEKKSSKDQVTPEQREKVAIANHQFIKGRKR